ncbi:MAG: hypothetical protein QM652_11665 [Legionella sp.]|uniref:hypothetical protein n=1 Tax=Legionella sp. TaxID=459 RepID=UPI0039E2D0CE
MLKTFFDKMNNGMLWVLVIPIASLISALATLGFAYSFVIWKSDSITVEGSWGKITAAATHIKNQNIKAISYNQQLTETANQLSQLLNDVHEALGQSEASHFLGNTSIQNKFTGISKSLKQQSEFLVHQKEELENINIELLHFQNQLKDYSK